MLVRQFKFVRSAFAALTVTFAVACGSIDSTGQELVDNNGDNGGGNWCYDNSTINCNNDPSVRGKPCRKDNGETLICGCGFWVPQSVADVCNGVVDNGKPGTCPEYGACDVNAKVSCATDKDIPLVCTAACGWIPAGWVCTAPDASDAATPDGPSSDAPPPDSIFEASDETSVSDASDAVVVEVLIDDVGSDVATDSVSADVADDVVTSDATDTSDSSSSDSVVPPDAPDTSDALMSDASDAADTSDTSDAADVSDANTCGAAADAKCPVGGACPFPGVLKCSVCPGVVRTCGTCGWLAPGTTCAKDGGVDAPVDTKDASADVSDTSVADALKDSASDAKDAVIDVVVDVPAEAVVEAAAETNPADADAASDVTSDGPSESSTDAAPVKPPCVQNGPCGPEWYQKEVCDTSLGKLYCLKDCGMLILQGNSCPVMPPPDAAAPDSPPTYDPKVCIVGITCTKMVPMGGTCNLPGVGTLVCGNPCGRWVAPGNTCDTTAPVEYDAGVDSGSEAAADSATDANEAAIDAAADVLIDDGGLVPGDGFTPVANSNIFYWVPPSGYKQKDDAGSVVIRGDYSTVPWVNAWCPGNTGFCDSPAPICTMVPYTWVPFPSGFICDVTKVPAGVSLAYDIAHADAGGTNNTGWVFDRSNAPLGGHGSDFGQAYVFHMNADFSLSTVTPKYVPNDPSGLYFNAVINPMP